MIIFNGKQFFLVGKTIRLFSRLGSGFFQISPRRGMLFFSSKQLFNIYFEVPIAVTIFMPTLTKKMIT
jgi:hypothetical protein